MYGVYYKLPLKFKDIVEKKDLEKISLESSISQYIELVLTSHFGECKFDETFGCKIWETDFDLLTNTNDLRDRVRKDIMISLSRHEQRLTLADVETSVGMEQVPSYNGTIRVKKKISMKIRGFVKKTNRSLTFNMQFFIGPFS